MFDAVPVNGVLWQIALQHIVRIYPYKCTEHPNGLRVLGPNEWPTNAYDGRLVFQLSTGDYIMSDEMYADFMTRQEQMQQAAKAQALRQQIVPVPFPR